MVAQLAVGVMVAAWFAGVALAQPAVEDLGPLSGDVAAAPAAGSQTETAVARGGAGFLVVWADARGGGSGSQAAQSEFDIVGVRLDAQGAPLDATPLLIAGGAGVQRTPRVAWNGQSWLVAYESQDPVGGYWEMRTRAKRVSASGQVLDAQALTLGAAGVGFDVAGSVGEWLVTSQPYHADGFGTYMAGQRISDAGVVLNPVPVMILDWVYGHVRAVAVDGGYVVAGPDWNDSTLIRARRVTAALAPVGNVFTLPSMNIASRGGELYATWIRGFVDVVGSPVSLAGVRAIPGGTVLFTDPAPQHYQTRVTHDGAAWWFGRGAGSEWWTRNVSHAGAPLGSESRLPIVIGGTSDLAANFSMHGRDGGGVTCMWDDSRPATGNDTNVYAMAVGADNTPVAETCVSTGPRLQRDPDLCLGPGGVRALVTVSEAANDDRILLRLLDADGAAIGPEWIEVHRAPTVGRASIAWDGTRYMVAWDEGPAGSTPVRVRARRLDAGGVAVDVAPLEVMDGFNVAVGALGGRFLVAASRYGSSIQFINLHGRRIDGASGMMLDGPGGVLLGGGYHSGQPRVRSDGAQWLVCSHSMWAALSSQGDATLAKVPFTGTPTMASNPTPVSGGTGDLDVAFSGREYLLVWRSNTLAAANNLVAGRFMNADGTFRGNAFTIVDAPGRQLRPVATFDGTHFVVAWEDQRAQTSFFDARTDVYAVRIATDGRIVDPLPWVVSAVVDGDATPALVSEDGVTLAAVSRFNASGPCTYRLALTRIGERPCVADFNRDGGVDGADIEAFFLAWQAGAATADVNLDGGVDGADVETFFVAWQAGGC